MKKLQNHRIGVDQGDVLLFSDFEDGGDMWEGSGARRASREVRFSEPYRLPPTVHVGLSMWDMDQTTNSRTDVRAEEVSEQGFNLVFRTWGDTRIARARAVWLSIGEVAHNDDWDIG